jgi:hypothetical protein
MYTGGMTPPLYIVRAKGETPLKPRPAGRPSRSVIVVVVSIKNVLSNQ